MCKVEDKGNMFINSTNKTHPNMTGSIQTFYLRRDFLSSLFKNDHLKNWFPMYYFTVFSHPGTQTMAAMV